MQAQLLLNMTGLVYFAAAVVIMLPIYALEHPFFEQFKISDKPWAWRSASADVRNDFWALSLRSLKLFFFNYGVIVPVFTIGKYFLLGDSMSFSVHDWPSYKTLFIHNVAMTLLHELAFYWSHRLAHHPRLYKFHKVLKCLFPLKRDLFFFFWPDILSITK